jgi:hypothetical protein
MMYYPTSYVAVIFPIFDAAARMKTDLMSELEFLQLLAELGEEGLVLPDHHAGSTHQIKNHQKPQQTILKGRIANPLLINAY